MLFHNRGDGTFEDVSVKAGVSDPAKLHGMGVVWGDYDNDGWPDLFVTNDSGPNYLYHNLGMASLKRWAPRLARRTVRTARYTATWRQTLAISIAMDSWTLL